MTLTASGLVILRWLNRRDSATASAIGAACGMSPGEIRTHLGTLEKLGLIAERTDNEVGSARSVYVVTSDGRSKLAIGTA